MTETLLADSPLAPPARPIRALPSTLLDTVDVAVLAVDTDLRLRHANRRGLARLAEGVPLRHADGGLWPVDAGVRATWSASVRAAAAGDPRYLALPVGSGGAPVVVGLVRIEAAEVSEPLGAAFVAVVFGTVPADSSTRVGAFASLHGLTPAETRVLRYLAAHLPPKRIASALGLAEATVRSHVSSILCKAGVATTRVLAARLAALPPIG